MVRGAFDCWLRTFARVGRIAPIRRAAKLLFLVVPAVHAGDVDLALAISMEPPGPYRSGQTVALEFGVTNLGPDTAGADAPVGVADPVSLFATLRVNAAYRLPVVVEPRDLSACRIEFVEFEPPPGLAYSRPVVRMRCRSAR